MHMHMRMYMSMDMCTCMFVDTCLVTNMYVYAPTYMCMYTKCTIQLAYAIGVARPLSFYINTHDTGKVDSETLIKKINSIVDLTPRGIRDHLNLHKPIYKSSAAYGHFGREPGDDGSFSWEKTDLVDQLKNL